MTYKYLEGTDLKKHRLCGNRTLEMTVLYKKILSYKKWFLQFKLQLFKHPKNLFSRHFG